MLIQRKGLLQRLPVLAVAAVLALGLVPARPAQAQEQTFYACYVPDVGAIYLIKLEGLPGECLSTGHVEISWTEGGSATIPDNSITTAKLVDLAVTTAKLAAPVSIASNNMGSRSNLPTTPTNLGLVQISAPTSGRVLLILTGHAIFFGEGTEAVLGLGTTAGSLNLHETRMGTIDGTANLRYEHPFTTLAVVSVTAGTRNFYATGYKPSIFSRALVNLGSMYLVAIFIPD